MVLVLPTLFHVATIAIAAPFTPTNAGGSTYVISVTGPWLEPTCQEYNSQVLGLEEILNVFEDEATCDDGVSSTHAFTTGQIAITETGLAAFVDGGGYAHDGEGIDAFSRHDYLATVDVDSEVDRRIRVDWSLYASGLGSVFTTVKRLGNIGGPNDPAKPIFEEVANAYISPIIDGGVEVLRMPAGRWRCTIMSTHQSHSGKKGFKVGVSQLSHTVTVVALGDVDGNGTVNTSDLLAVIGAWGACDYCLEDLDGDGLVGVSDILQVIADW
jgi:hypothetical protein